jgi:hypothetical protein
LGHKDFLNLVIIESNKNKKHNGEVETKCDFNDKREGGERGKGRRSTRH